MTVDQPTRGPGSATGPSGHRRAWTGLTGPVLLVGLAGSIVAAVMIGPVGIPVHTVVGSIVDHLHLGGEPSNRGYEGIVWNLRLPQVLMAALCGMGLAAIGAVMQAVTRNPLADPYLLGLSSGASLGAVIVVAAGLGTVGSSAVAFAAFVGSAVAFVAVLAVATTHGRLPPVRTVLAGVAVGEMCAAATSFVTISSTNAHATRSVLAWLLGGFAGTTWDDLRLVVVVLVVFTVAVFVDARVLDALALGDDTAQSLGIDVHRARRRLLIASAVLTGVLVAANGAVGVVGLVVPHVVRPIVGGRHRAMLPIAMLVGGIFLVWVDVIARTAFAPEEVPVGVITALVGAPFFAWQIRRQGQDDR